MDFKLFTLLGLGLALAPTLITTDLHVAQAQANCSKPPCNSKIYGASRYGSGRLPAELIAEGDAYKVQGKYDLANESYSKALELAIKNQDLESQAIARRGLNELSNKSNKPALNAPSQLQNNNSLQLQNQLQR